MPAYTPFLNLYKLGGGSTGLITPDETVDVDRINQNMDAIDSNASSWGNPAQRNHQFYGTAAGLASVTGMKRGDTYQESDGSFRQWRYDGSNWVSNEGGMFLVRPSSVTGTNVNIDSKGHTVGASVPASTAVAVIGLFDFSKYKRYRVLFSQEKTAIPVNNSSAFRNASGPVNTASYWLTEAIISGGSTSITVNHLNGIPGLAYSIDAVGKSTLASLDLSISSNDILRYHGQVSGSNGEKESKYMSGSFESPGNAIGLTGLQFAIGVTTSFDLAVYAYA